MLDLAVCAGFGEDVVQPLMPLMVIGVWIIGVIRRMRVDARGTMSSAS